MNLSPHPEIRKAAILIDSLDEDSANLLLGQLNQETASLVTRQLCELSNVTVAEKERVLADFLKTVQLVGRHNGLSAFQEVRNA